MPNVVPLENVERLKAEMAAFLGIADLDQPAHWYQDGAGAYGQSKYQIGPGMVEMYQTQAMWDIRQCPKLHQAFSEVHKTSELVVSLDRVNMKPPVLEGDDRPWGTGLGLHWDGPRPGMPRPAASASINANSGVGGSLRSPLSELRVQGFVSLSDTSEEGGGFICVYAPPSTLATFQTMRTCCLHVALPPPIRSCSANR